MNRQTLFPALAAAPAVPAGSGAAMALETIVPSPQAAPPAASGGSLLPSLPDVNFSWSGYFEALAILCLLLAGIWALLWLVKRRGNSGFFASSTPAMRVESRLALGPKKWLLVVRYLDRRLVLGITDKSITLLTEMYDQEFASERNTPETLAGGRLSLAKKAAAGARKGERADDVSGRADTREDKKDSLSFASLLKKDRVLQEPPQ